MDKFSIGSYVRVINKNLESYGLIGQIINLEKMAVTILLALDNG